MFERSLTIENKLADGQVLVFTHSPSPPVENEEKEDAEKGKVEEEEPEGGNLGKVDEEEVKAEDLERRASIHFVSRPVRLRPGEKLIAEVSSSSTPAVLSSPMPGDSQSSQDKTMQRTRCWRLGKDRSASPG